MKHKIVLVPFPFDDLSATKVRPAVCLTDEINPYGHIVLAFITSKVAGPGPSDFVIDAADVDFVSTGLKVSSTIRLHRLVTVSRTLVKRQLGKLAPRHVAEVGNRVRQLFQL
jgi:mRNA interferase MazF